MIPSLKHTQSPNWKQNPTHGLTLMELLITLAISSVLLLTFLSVSFYIVRSYELLRAQYTLQTETTRMLNQLRNDVRWSFPYIDPATSNSLNIRIPNPETLIINTGEYTAPNTITYTYVAGPDIFTLSRQVDGGANNPVHSDDIQITNFQFELVPGTNQGGANVIDTLDLVRIRFTARHRNLDEVELEITPDVTFTQHRQTY